MGWRVRTATPDDLPAIATITRRARRQLAAWEPHYWLVADGADAAHEAWLRRLLESDRAHVRVLVSDETADGAAPERDAVVGCAATVRQVGHWFVDDLAVADDGWWGDGMVELLRQIVERPALSCVPRQDVRKAACCAAAGMRPRSTYWLLRLEGVEPHATDAERVTPTGSLPPPAPHSFAPIDPAADGTLAFRDRSGGVCVLGPSVAAPPVYDPGGTSGLVDRATGKTPGPLIDAATTASADRGDVQLVVVCAEDALLLQDALIDRGFRRIVDVHGWPGPRR